MSIVVFLLLFSFLFIRYLVDNTTKYCVVVLAVVLLAFVGAGIVEGGTDSAWNEARITKTRVWRVQVLLLEGNDKEAVKMLREWNNAVR